MHLWRFRSIDPSPPRFIGKCILAHRTIHAAYNGSAVYRKGQTGSKGNWLQTAKAEAARSRIGFAG